METADTGVTLDIYSRAVNEPSQCFTVLREGPYLLGPSPCWKCPLELYLDAMLNKHLNTVSGCKISRRFVDTTIGSWGGSELSTSHITVKSTVKI